MTKRRLAVCALLFAAAPLWADAWPGGVAFIDLGPADAPQPVAKYDGRRVLVTADGSRWQAVVGIPLDATLGTAAIELGDGRQIAVDVREHAYREQHLEVAPGFVSLSEANLERVGRERKIIDAALNNWRDAPVATVALQPPADGPQSSSFGLRRFFNQQPRSPHKGMDIAAPAGSAVVAPLAGVVAATGDFFFNGKTVLVDHGQGYVTMYCHLSEIAAEPGQALTPGERLGSVGATGRVTGAHLHFGTYLNGTAVDPAILLQKNRK